MKHSKIPQGFGNFDRIRAFELLKLVSKAHERYDISKQKGTDKKEIEGIVNIDNIVVIKDDKTGKKVEESLYEFKEVCGHLYDVRANLVFTQINWLSPLTFFKQTLLFGFIARRMDSSDIYVVFRGTSSIGEWITNFKFIQQSYTKVQSDYSPGETHWGFRRTYDRPESRKNDALWITRLFDRIFLRKVKPMKDIVEETLIKECPPGSPPARIFVTGHSLGGALGTLAAAHINSLIERKKISAFAPILYTFASPRIGDEDFADNFCETDIECYRIVNSEDIVPKVPFPTLLFTAPRMPVKNGALSLTSWLNSKIDYEHVGLPIYFTSQKSNISDNHTIPVYLEAFASTDKQ